MGLLEFLKPKPQVEERATVDDMTALYSTILGYDTLNSENIGEIISLVGTAIDTISSEFASLEVDLTDGYNEVIKDGRTKLLNNQSQLESAYFVKKKACANMLVYGVSYVYNEKVGNKIVDRIVLDNKYIQQSDIKEKYRNGKVVGFEFKYQIKDKEGNSIGKPIICNEINTECYNISGRDGKFYLGRTLFDRHKSLFEIIKEEQVQHLALLHNTSRPNGVLETTSKLSKETLMKLRKSWESLYSGTKNSGKTVILEDGLSYKQISNPISNSGILESRHANIKLMENVFILPNGWFTDKDENKKEFYRKTIVPITNIFKSEHNRVMLLEVEKEKGLTFEFLSIKRLTITREQIENVDLQMNSGLMTINQGLLELGRKPIKEGNRLKYSLGDVFYDIDKEQFDVPNKGADNGGTGNKATQIG